MSDLTPAVPDPEHDPAAREPYSVADLARRGTSRGPGPRPGARKPHRRKGKGKGNQAKSFAVYTPEERRAAIQKRIEREVARADFARRAVELRRLNHTYVEIAQLMSVERAEQVTAESVRRSVINTLRNTEAIDDVRYAELDKLESLAANLRKKLDEMDVLPGISLDLEVYAKVADTYLKYRERIAKLVGLDAPVRQHVSRDSGPVDPGLGGSVHIGADGITVRMPGSIAAYEDWATLDAKGLLDVAGQVLELEETDHSEEVIGLHGSHHDAKAGLTLAPEADVTPGAERPEQPPKSERLQSALEALEAFRRAEQ